MGAAPPAAVELERMRFSLPGPLLGWALAWTLALAWPALAQNAAAPAVSAPAAIAAVKPPPPGPPTPAAPPPDLAAQLAADQSTLSELTAQAGISNSDTRLAAMAAQAAQIGAQ